MQEALTQWSLGRLDEHRLIFASEYRLFLGFKPLGHSQATLKLCQGSFSPRDI